jgi:glycerophosphoryl diester phosphodiesterase
MKFLVFLTLFSLFGCSKLNLNIGRAPSSIKNQKCFQKPSSCNFHIIAHRGAPRVDAENTLGAYDAALELGANALEIDITISKDKQVFIFHDRDPEALLSVLRLMGIEGFKYIPYFPNKNSPYFKKADELTFDEIQTHWGYTESVGGKRDPKKLIPSLKSFSKWAYKQPKLEAIYIDFKIESDQIEHVPWVAKEIEHLFKNAHFDTMIMVPRVDIYEELKSWSEEHKAHFKVLMDFEKHGAPETYKKYKFKSASLGSTIFTQWDKYLNELSQILQIKKKNKYIYPVVSWTVDDAKQMYTLVQKGVDGIVTNDPDLLYQIKNRHYKDHAKIVHLINRCAQSEMNSNWQYCGNGHDIAPLKSITLSEVKSWLCNNYHYQDEIKSLFGCNIKADDVMFIDPVTNSQDLQIWKNPEGKIFVLNVPRSKTKEALLLNANENMCHDGVLNYSCEYLLNVHYLDSQHNVIEEYNLKNKFDGHIFAPLPIVKGSQFIKFIIHEVDNDDIQDTYEQTFPSQHVLNGTIHYPLIMGSKNDTFQLWSSLQKVKLPEVKKYPTKDFQLNFNTLHCNDGFLNNNCEYKLRIGYKNVENRMVYKFKEVNQNKFLHYFTVPSYVEEISIEVVEKDEKEDINSSRVKVDLQLFHGSHKALKAPDNTFSTYIKLLNYNYNHEQFDDQGFSKQKSKR